MRVVVAVLVASRARLWSSFLFVLQNNPGFQVGTDFISNNQIPGIDFATLHSYPDQWLPRSGDQFQLQFLNNWLDSHFRDAQFNLWKPLMATEFGKSSKDAGYSISQRDALFQTVYSKIYQSAKSGGAAVGCLFWQLLDDDMNSMRDGYEVVLDETTTTARIISTQSRQLRYIGRLYAMERNVARMKKDKAVREIAPLRRHESDRSRRIQMDRRRRPLHGDSMDVESRQLMREIKKKKREIGKKKRSGREEEALFCG
ncbi:Mannan endo-1,4-beta-mannosidase 1 [Platanthera guangdongensis]|uniref:Mannan endo-1,4-beta-mannosidase 1 n=1 Tax=Platanthera guangdongensis TaxID=2320717 RepID=A0ABR2MMR4_9ASPA